MKKVTIASLQEQIQKIREERENELKQHIRFEEDGSIALLDGTNRIYRPSPTFIQFHATELQVRHAMGPFNSGKTTGCLFEILRLSCLKMPKGIDGIRRARCFFIRNTSGELETTTIKSWLDWFGHLGTIHIRKKPVYCIEHTFNDGNGLIQLECLFLACDREEDLSKLRSAETSWAYCNELSELPEGLLGILKGRVGRYPPRHICPELPLDENWGRILSDTNPPATDHWLYKRFEVECPPNYKLFKQPSGLLIDEEGKLILDEKGYPQTNPGAENLPYIAHNFYVNMALGESMEYVKVFCLGQYGIFITGKPVYPMYNDDLHSTDEELKIDPAYPVYSGWDYGLTPAHIVCQFIDGQLRVIKEFVSDNCSIPELVNDAVKPWYLSQGGELELLPGDYDPSNPRSYSDNLAASEHIIRAGLLARPAISNNPIQRIDAVKHFLMRLTNGKPSFVISRKGCPELRKGFMGHYQYRRVQVLGKEVFKDAPDKIHPISDIHDALQYVALRLTSEEGFNKTKQKIKTNIHRGAMI